MIGSATMARAPVAVLDMLNSLLEAELNSIFRFMGEGSPYLTRATAAVRRPLEKMVGESERHARALSEMIEQLGGSPVPRLEARPEDQYLAYLSLQFLLPKLVEAERLLIRRYKNALRALEALEKHQSQVAEVTELLRSHLDDHAADLEILEKAASDVAATRR